MEDKTIYVRRHKGKDARDVEITEVTTFSDDGYPTVEKTVRSEVLSCGHTAGRQNQAGYCQARRFLFWKHEREVCVEFCLLQCPRCSRWVCTQCARAYYRVLFCKGCFRNLTLIRIAKGIWKWLLEPFMKEPQTEFTDPWLGTERERFRREDFYADETEREQRRRRPPESI